MFRRLFAMALCCMMLCCSAFAESVSDSNEPAAAVTAAPAADSAPAATAIPKPLLLNPSMGASYFHRSLMQRISTLDLTTQRALFEFDWQGTQYSLSVGTGADFLDLILTLPGANTTHVQISSEQLMIERDGITNAIPYSAILQALQTIFPVSLDSAEAAASGINSYGMQRYALTILERIWQTLGQPAFSISSRSDTSSLTLNIDLPKMRDKLVLLADDILANGSQLDAILRPFLPMLKQYVPNLGDSMSAYLSDQWAKIRSSVLRQTVDGKLSLTFNYSSSSPFELLITGKLLVPANTFTGTFVLSQKDDGGFHGQGSLYAKGPVFDITFEGDSHQLKADLSVSQGFSGARKAHLTAYYGQAGLQAALTANSGGTLAAITVALMDRGAVRADIDIMGGNHIDFQSIPATARSIGSSTYRLNYDDNNTSYSFELATPPLRVLQYNARQSGMLATLINYLKVYASRTDRGQYLKSYYSDNSWSLTAENNVLLFRSPELSETMTITFEDSDHMIVKVQEDTKYDQNTATLDVQLLHGVGPMLVATATVDRSRVASFTLTARESGYAAPLNPDHVFTSSELLKLAMQLLEIQP